MIKYLKWDHPAVPIKGIKVRKVYELDNLLKLFSLDEIKVLFKPDNFKWEDLEVKNTFVKVDEVEINKTFDKLVK